MRKSHLALLLVAVLVAGFFDLVPTYLDRNMNRVDPLDSSLAVGEEAAALHSRLTVIDLHADPLLWRRDLLVENDYGQVDLPRLEAGNVAVQVFAAATKSPPPPVPRSYASEDKQTELHVFFCWY